MAERQVDVFLHKTRDSIVQNVITVASLTSMVGIGVILESTAMQWAAAIIWFLSIMGMAIRIGTRSRMSIPEAQEQLAKWAQESAKEG